MKGDKIVFRIKVPGEIPSFKNRKTAILDSASGKMRTLTQKSVKERMDRMESAIVSQLYSISHPTESATPLECLKQLRTFLSGLSDDSIREIPCGSWDVQRCKKGEEGATIIIEEI
jgi:hypothetical protein